MGALDDGGLLPSVVDGITIRCGGEGGDGGGVFGDDKESRKRRRREEKIEKKRKKKIQKKAKKSERKARKKAKKAIKQLMNPRLWYDMGIGRPYSEGWVAPAWDVNCRFCGKVEGYICDNCAREALAHNVSSVAGSVAGGGGIVVIDVESDLPPLLCGWCDKCVDDCVDVDCRVPASTSVLTESRVGSTVQQQFQPPASVTPERTLTSGGRLVRVSSTRKIGRSPGGNRMWVADTPGNASCIARQQAWVARRKLDMG